MTGGYVLGILAGSGKLPRRIAEHCIAVGRPYLIIAFEGQAEAETLVGLNHVWNKLGRVDHMLSLMRNAEIQEVVMVGGIVRPSLLAMSLDARAFKILTMARGVESLGDDGLLRLLAAELEKEGFRVVEAASLLTDVRGGILTPVGIFTKFAPDETAMRDIARGVAVIRMLGKLDIGQAVVVQQGLVLGIEAIEGTDSLLERAAVLRRDGPGGVLVKAIKPGQDKRFDLPTIGTTTIAKCAAAKLTGIALSAGLSQIIDFTETVEAADFASLFLIGYEDVAFPEEQM